MGVPNEHWVLSNINTEYDVSIMSGLLLGAKNKQKKNVLPLIHVEGRAVMMFKKQMTKFMSAKLK